MFFIVARTFYSVQDYLDVKGLALLRAGRKLTPLRTSLARLAAVLSRRGVKGFEGFEGEELVRELAEYLERTFRERYSIPEGEIIYVYRGDVEDEEFHHDLADRIFEKGAGDPRSEEFRSLLLDLYAPHVFRPHLELSHLYAR